MEYVGWIGNIFIVVGLWLIGNKESKAFVFSIIGESIWTIYSLFIGMYDLAFICAVFAIIALRNYILWKNPSKNNLRAKE